MAKQTDGKSPKSPLMQGKKAPTEIGDTSGIAISGIIVNDDYNNKLVGKQGVQIYNQMRFGDATVNSSLLAVMLPILSARWWVEPAPAGSRQDKKVAEFVEAELMDNGTRTWQETLNEILDYLVYGRMVFEIVWEFRYGDDDTPMIGLRKLARRAPDSIVAWKLKDGKPGVIQQTINGTFEIPMDKLIIFVNQKKGDNWEGVSLLRTAYKHWYMKDKMYLIDAIAAERQGLGVPKAKVPANTKEADVQKVEEILQNLRANEKGYAVEEGDIEIDFMDMKSGSTKPLLPAIQHHDRAIALNVLAQFLQLGSTSVGSFALSNDQSKLFLLCLEAIANHIRDNINRYLIKKLVDFNFDVTDYPTLRFEKIGNVDHNMLTTSLQRAVQTGLLVPQPDDEEYLRDVMDLPEKNKFQPIDPTLFDDTLAELDMSMANLDSAFTPDSATPVAPDEMSDEELMEAAEEFGVDIVLYGGRVGEPLSEEAKKKISEALKKYWSSRKSSGKGKGKGKAKNPELDAKRKESTKLRKEVRALNTEYRKKILELKAKGQKLSEEESAKMQLELLDKKSKLQDRIDSLADEIQAIKDKTSGGKKKKDDSEDDDSKEASDVGATLDRLNGLIDRYEK